MEPVTITGEGAADGSEETIDIGMNGGTPASTLAVPLGKKLVLTDMLVSAAQLPCEFIVQQSRDAGANWFNVMLERSAGQDSNMIPYQAPRAIKGGADVLIRVQQVGAAGAVSVTLIGWLEDSKAGKGALSDNFALPCATGRNMTGGTAEETLPIGVDFNAPASAIQIPRGVTWEITDWVVCATLGTVYRIQQSDDSGSTWYDKAIARVVGGGPSEHFPFKTPIVIVGSDQCQMRLRVATPTGAAEVDVTLGVLQTPPNLAVVPIP
jgi:hypothetical protein